VSGQQEHPPPLLLAAPGQPGTYEPEVPPAERPRNIGELRERVRVVTPEPWPAGARLPLSKIGRYAHWTGTDWKLNESPGYPAGETVTANRSETEQTTGGERP
jgi:hypothetical protein